MENTKQNSSEILEEKILKASKKIEDLTDEVHKKIVWQDKLIRNLIIWLLAKWHILLEWVPGLAKTLTIATLSKTVDLGFNRIQFTPDLLPNDLIWTEIYNVKNWEFSIKKWPIFNNFILADEINRAPSKVQSALLEAMAEKQVTIWNETFELEQPFIVLATQNPIEQSWVYKLPEAQLDRFLLKTVVSYPKKEDEIKMYQMLNSTEKVEVKNILTKKEILEIQELVEEIHVSENIFKYVADIVNSSRFPENYNLENAKKYLSYWISPRWGLSLISAAKVIALMDWRSFVIPEDIKEIAEDALNHRIWLNYEAIASDVKESDITKEIFSSVKVI